MTGFGYAEHGVRPVGCEVAAMSLVSVETLFAKSRKFSLDAVSGYCRVRTANKQPCDQLVKKRAPNAVARMQFVFGTIS
jgi:hypothetical protein